MSANTGASSLPRKRRNSDPMAVFDKLPAPLRQWLTQAVLPWSPSSAQRIWAQSVSKGCSPEQALTRLKQAEAKTLAREKRLARKAV